MRTLIRTNLITLAAFFAGGLCFGDTLTLKNGDIVDGTYLGGTARVLRMEVNGQVQTFDISMVTGLQFMCSAGVRREGRLRRRLRHRLWTTGPPRAPRLGRRTIPIPTTIRPAVTAQY